MPRRNEQEFEERRQQILDGALRVFAVKGFEEATNKEIAHSACIGSPGLIYHYFEDKNDLFRQVLEHKMPVLQLLAHADELMEQPPRQVLMQIGRAYLHILDNPQATTFMKLMVSEMARRPAVAQMVHEVGPGRAFAFLSTYFQRQMTLGVLRPVDPAMAVYQFISPIVLFLLRRVLFAQPDALAPSAESFIEDTIEFFLRAMMPSPPGPLSHAAGEEEKTPHPPAPSPGAAGEGEKTPHPPAPSPGAAGEGEKK